MDVLSQGQINRRRDVLLEYSTAVHLLYAVADLAAVVLAAVLAYTAVSGQLVLTKPYQVATLLAVLLTHVVFTQAGVYHSWRGRSLFEQTRTVIIGWLSVLSGLILFAFLLNVGGAFSRLWLFYWAVGGLLMLLLSRLAAALVLRHLRSRGWNHKRVAIVGAGHWGAEVIRRILDASWIGIDVVCVLDHDEERHGDRVHGVPVLGGYDMLPSLLNQKLLDEVWICLPLRTGGTQTVDHVEQILHLLRHSTVAQRFVPDLAESRLMNKPVTEVLDLPVVDLNSSPMRGLNRLIKEAADRLMAAVLLIVLSPLMVAIAVAIRLDSRGPVLFKQMRHGSDGRPIRIYKFRTMTCAEPGEDFVQVRKGDCRITRIGALLRRTSLDELPQLYNVLQGKMSLVGPRPHPIQLNHEFMDKIDSYMQRHKVKPGITGWAQVNGLRGETDTLDKMQQRVEYDLYYIDNWSLWFDIKILILTLLRGFVHPNAY